MARPLRRLLAALALSRLTARAVAICSADRACIACPDNDATRCTACAVGHVLSDLNDVGEGLCSRERCEWVDEDAHEWYSKILVGSLSAGAVALFAVVVASLPVCCGVMKDGNLPLLGAAVGVVACLCMAVPFVVGAATSGEVVDDVCRTCKSGCTARERREIQEAISLLGAFVAYSGGFGFVAVVLGGIALCLALCMCNPSCGPLEAHQFSKQEGRYAQSQVVGWGTVASEF